MKKSKLAIFGVALAIFLTGCGQSGNGAAASGALPTTEQPAASSVYNETTTETDYENS